jgi:NADH-quinone oxidoreductase subunit E
MMVNWEFFDNQTPGSARAVVDDLRAGAPVRPSRGPNRVCSFKEVSRTLAGFSDGLADEGVGAGPATLEGLNLARQKGWSAPSARQGSRDGSGDAPVEQVAADHIADPAHPSANDAAAQGQAGDAATDSAEKPAAKKAAAKRAPRKPASKPTPEKEA